MNNRVKILIISAFVAILFFGMGVPSASAQVTDVVLTWQAFNFYPSNYQGKAPATLNSDVIVSATLLENGQTTLSSEEFKWYVNGNLYEKGVGLQEISITPELGTGNEIIVKLVIGSLASGITTTQSISVREPEVVIEHNSPENIFGGRSAVVRAVPYFFGVNSFSNISFSWKINNLTQEESSSRLEINSNEWEEASTRGLRISVTARNSSNLIESSSANKKIYAPASATGEENNQDENQTLL